MVTVRFGGQEEADVRGGKCPGPVTLAAATPERTFHVPATSSSLTFFHIHGPREGRSASISAAVILVCYTFLAGYEYSHVNM